MYEYDKEIAGVGRNELIRMLKEMREQVDVKQMLERSVERAKLLAENARLKAELEQVQDKRRACCPSDNHTCEHDPPQPKHCSECHAMWVHHGIKIPPNYYEVR